MAARCRCEFELGDASLDSEVEVGRCSIRMFGSNAKLNSVLAGNGGHPFGVQLFWVVTANAFQLPRQDVSTPGRDTCGELLPIR